MATLLIFAAIFQDTAFFIPGAVLALFLGYRALTFDRAIHRLGTSFAVDRSVDSLITRPGRVVRVCTDATFSPTPLSVVVTDLLPPGALLSSGTSCTRVSGTHAVLSYTFQPTIQGNVSFSGIAIRMSDPFFLHSLELTGARHRNPEISVYPEYRRELKGTGAMGEQEKEQIVGIRGHTVQYFREFFFGDDPRSIDWKLTAKFGKPYIRQYGTASEDRSLIVLDCPGPGASYDPALLSRVIGRTGSMVETTIQRYRSCSLLVIAGPNVIHYFSEEPDLQKVLRAMADFPAASGLRHLYRAHTAGVIAAFSGQIKRDMAFHPPGTTGIEFCRILQEWYHGLGGHPGASPFEVQMNRTLKPFAGSTVHIFSLFAGDISHLGQVLEVAERWKIRVILHPPGEFASSEPLSNLSRYPSVGVSAV